MEHDTDRKQGVRQVFSAQGAEQWSRLYERPANVFEDSMIRRRDYVCELIRRRFPQSTRVLDLGCGTGVIGENLVNAGMDVVAMDLSPDMVTRSRDRLNGVQRDGHRVLRGDCERLPFRNGEFDVVVCLGVISFLKRNEPMLSEIRRVLRGRGTLILAVRNKYDLALVLDPLRALRPPVGRLLRALGLRRRALPDEISLPRFFYLPRLVTTLEGDGFLVSEKHRIGYGPLTVNGREILPSSVSVRLSHALTGLFRLPILNLCRRLADVCVLVADRRTS